jgi:hypothetical protein
MSDEEFAVADVAGKSKIRTYDDELHEHAGSLQPFQESPPTIFTAFALPVDHNVHPQWVVLTRLWHAKEPGQIIDLYLTHGAVFSPEFYAETLSQPAFGVFGRRSQDGDYTLTMIPWDTIARLEIRPVKQVPVGILK